MGGGGAPSAPKPPKFVPIDRSKLYPMMEKQDRAFYDYSDKRQKELHPELVAAVDKSIADANAGATGTDPYLAGVEKQSGLGDFNVGKGSIQQSKNMGASGLNILGRDQRNNTYFQNLYNSNPQIRKRVFGPTGADTGNLAYADTNSQNLFNANNFTSRMNAWNSSVNQNIQNSQAMTGAIGSGLGDIGRVFSSLYQPNYLATTAYGPTTPMGVNGVLGGEWTPG